MEDYAPSQEQPRMSGESAIEAHLESVYGKAPDGSWTNMREMLGQRGLSHVDYYRQDGPVPHWLFVTYGFSELDGKVTGQPEVSGGGFELTFRLKRGDEQGSQEWVNRMLHDYADYSFSTLNAFNPYDYMTYSIDAPQANGFVGALFVPDPELGTLETPNGRVQFLEIVPLLGTELDALQGGFAHEEEYAGKAKEIAERLASSETSLYITDLGRNA